ncbi:MAG: DUF2892 domain-containing protein [Synechococcales cyanobacterium RM1_1_8]|nr:DUF2892 domain-containing protein [Synechococcales cyanobacterium RM1_1_8]
MSSNVGTIDRLVRLTLASILFYLGLMTYADSTLGIALDAAGAVMALTGLLGFCGLYKLLGINSRQSDSNSQAS